MSERPNLRQDDIRIAHSDEQRPDSRAQRPDSRGRTADRPGDIPTRGLKDVGLRVKDEIKNDRVPLVSAGVAFYAMLALFPAITALISLYGLVANPQVVQQQIDTLTDNLGGGTGELIADQASSIAQAGTGALTVGVAVSVLAALWAASSGMHGLMQALTLAHNEDETRGLVRRRAIALALTILALFVAVAAMLVIVGVPAALQIVGLGAAGEWAIRILRWPLMAAVVVGVLAIIYRYAPNRDKPQWRWVSWGSVIATLLWILASFGFSIYVSNFGNYNETYGALGAVIVLLLWLFLSAFVVVLGGEINAELEHQTARDTTSGAPQPMGHRDAYVADHVADRPT